MCQVAFVMHLSFLSSGLVNRKSSQTVIDLNKVDVQSEEIQINT